MVFEKFKRIKFWVPGFPLHIQSQSALQANRKTTEIQARNCQQGKLSGDAHNTPTSTHLGMYSPPANNGHPNKDPSVIKAVTRAPLSSPLWCVVAFLKLSKADSAKPGGNTTFRSHATTRPAAPKQTSCAAGIHVLLIRVAEALPSSARLRERRQSRTTGPFTSSQDRHSDTTTGRQNAAPQTPASWNALIM